jgi:hypothetical protein
MRLTLLATLGISALLFMSACKGDKQSSESGTSAVDTANTAVKNQGAIGYCWSYAAVAMIESDFKKRTGREVDLSEEAIGFFHFAEQLKATMDYNLSNDKEEFILTEGAFINGTSKKMGSKDAFSLIERWGLIPESQWNVKFEDEIDKKLAISSIQEGFLELQEKIRGKQTSVQMNQIFEVLTKEAFPSIPPVDGFNNGSGQMNAVQYARNVIGFRPNAYQDVYIDQANAQFLESTLERVKKSLADGNVVGITISMPADSEWGNRIRGTRFAGFGQPFALEGAHAMTITDFKNSDSVFGPVPDVEQEISKKIDSGFAFKLKNSWGSQSGRNEFGQVVRTGFYDMDITYISDALKSVHRIVDRKTGKTTLYSGYVIFTFPSN